MTSPASSTATTTAVPRSGGRLGKIFAATTPVRLRMLSLATVASILATAAFGFGAARSLTSSSDRAEQNTGPVLIATQDAFASLAEADAASAAVFLAGAAEDREQRRLYEQALQRTTAQLAEVSRLVGDNPAAHDSVKSIAANLTTYAGLVETARLGNVEQVPGASAKLSEAIEIVQGGIVPEVESITNQVQAQLDSDVGGGKAAAILALLVGIAAIAIVIAGHAYLSRRSNRILNLPLIGAGVLVGASMLWLVTAWGQQQNDLQVAQDGGYDSIALTARIQTTAFRYKTIESLSLIATGDPAEQTQLAEGLAAVDLGTPSLIDAARRGEVVGQGILLDANRSADSTREQAATAEMLTRWDRYLETSQDISLAVNAGDRDRAVELAIGPGNADFNGFNTSVESVLLDNRTQFTDGLASARDRLNRLRAGMILLPVVAVALALWGYQLRIREYLR